MAENAVLQSLLPHYDGLPYYWSSDAKAEVEFVIQWETEIIPIEVKAESCVQLWHAGVPFPLGRMDLDVVAHTIM